MITKQFQNTTYSIELQISTTGIIDKTDIIGTLYKQLSNVLEDTVNFQEFVKKGLIGNISISIKNSKGNSKARCTIPTSLDNTMVCLLAAKCEQITKIGHTFGTIIVTDIIHSQKNIEEEIYSRAQELEQQFFSNKNEYNNHNSNSSTKYSNKATTISNTTKPQIIEIIPNCYGSSILESFDSIIFVEGRSDVKRLHQFGIYNALSVNGSHLDILRVKTLPWFNKKTLYLLLDGDSSAKKIALQLKEHFSFQNILYAPKEEEVSTLTKTKLFHILKKIKSPTSKLSVIPKTNTNPPIQTQEIKSKKNIEENKLESELQDKDIEDLEYFTKEEYFVIENYLQALTNSNRAVGFDNKLGLLFDIEISKFKQTEISNSHIIILDALLENSLSKKLKESPGLKCVIARGVSTPITNVLTISFEEFKNSIEE